jgi:hypothetical protein
MAEYRKSTRYTGMKKNPHEISPKNAIRDKVAGRKKKPKASPGSVSKRKGLSEYQLKTQEEFMKVRLGETREQWLIRTRYRRIRTEEELSLTKAGKRKVDKLTLERQDPKNKRIQLWVLNKDFNFLKYYVFIINWAVIKFDITQRDLEIGFHFYENIHFTHEEFTNKTRLFLKPTAGDLFFKFKKKGYLISNKSTVNSEVRRETGLYKLSPAFINILTKVYEKIAYAESFDFKPTLYKTIPTELEAVIIQMAQENQDIVLGKKEPDTIIIHEQHEDKRYKQGSPSKENI